MARGYCRICDFVRQSTNGKLYCSLTELEMCLNDDCDKFELDKRIKEFNEEYSENE